MRNIINNQTDIVIRKHNQIIQKTLNKFTTKQNQLMAVLLGKYVDLTNNECINTTITIKELREVLGLSKGVKNTKAITQAVQRFGEVGSIGIYDQQDNSYNWMPYFTYIKVKNDVVEFEWNTRMKPYLINLKNNYTQYLANDYLKLKSVYSQNLYEQLKSIQNYAMQYGKNPIIPLEDIKKAMNIHDQKSYTKFKYFNDLVLKKAVKEINEVTDIKVEVNNIYQGRSIIALEFDIEPKDKPKAKTSKQTKQRKNKPIINDIMPDYTITPEANKLLTNEEALAMLEKYNKENK